MKTKLQNAAHTVIHDCLKIQKYEKVVIVVDEPCRLVGEALWDAAKKIVDPIIIEISPRSIHGEEPPPLIAEVIRKSDVFILPTSRSLTHTRARIEANKHGARGATMPGITPEIMTRSLNADYRRIARVTERLAEILSRGRKARIETGTGAHLELSLMRRKGYIDTGLLHTPGAFSNLPGGEAYIAPEETQSNGKVVFDGSFAPVGFLRKPVTLHVKKGRIMKITGNKNLQTIFGKYGIRERVLCELGIGTNPSAKITGNVLEDEKTLGSIHLAFGNNLGFGGRNKARIHLDGVIRKPTIYIDETLIIKKGKFLL
ncbi:MAG: aminopeptidase [candidate division WOR-3 bacterium]|nr:MAG: aminopeptidase [candidate division WOR-3 bacterium]